MTSARLGAPVAALATVAAVLGLAVACGGSAENDGSAASRGGAAATGSGGGGALASGGSPEGPGSEFVDVEMDLYDKLVGVACAAAFTQFDAGTPGRLYLLETAETMLRVAPGREQSDWELARSAVRATLSEPQVCALSFFPNRETSPNFEAPLDVSECLDFSGNVGPFRLPSPDSGRLALETALASVSPLPGSGAPMLDAFGFAWQDARPILNRFVTPSGTMVVLIGDGQPSLDGGCMGSGDAREPAPFEPLLAEIEIARAAGVRTFVVGTPGSASTVAGTDARSSLSAAARAGGTAKFDCSDDGPNYCHFDLSTQAPEELPLALEHADRAEVSCTLLQGGPFVGPEPPPLNVLLRTEDGQIKLIRQSELAPCQYGWHFADDFTAELCPGTCAAVQRMYPASVMVLAPCCNGLPPIPP